MLLLSSDDADCDEVNVRAIEGVADTGDLLLESRDFGSAHR